MNLNMKHSSVIKYAQNSELKRLRRKGVDIDALEKMLDFDIAHAKSPVSFVDLFGFNTRKKCDELLSRTEDLMCLHKGQKYNDLAYSATVSENEIELKREITALSNDIIDIVFHKLRNVYKRDVSVAASKALVKYISPFFEATAYHESNTFQFFWKDTIDHLISRLIVKPLSDSHLLTFSWDRYIMTEYRMHFPESPVDSQIGDSTYFKFLSNCKFEEEVKSKMTDFLDVNITDRISDMFSDICEMYPLLLRGFSPNKNIFELPKGLGYMMVILNPDTVMMEVKIATTANQVVDFRTNNKLPAAFSFTWSGDILNGLSEWLPVKKQSVLHNFLVNQVHSALLPKYIAALEGIKVKQIDEDNLLYSTWQGYVSGVKKNEENRNQDVAPKRLSFTNIPKIRRQKFFKLCQSLGLCVESGKGSELKIFRPGKRIYILGTHGVKDDVVPAWLATKILTRAEVSQEEFQKALNTI